LQQPLPFIGFLQLIQMLIYNYDILYSSKISLHFDYFVGRK
jgi:hypothetical protein